MFRFLSSYYKNYILSYYTKQVRPAQAFRDLKRKKPHHTEKRNRSNLVKYPFLMFAVHRGACREIPLLAEQTNSQRHGILAFKIGKRLKLIPSLNYYIDTNASTQ
jgi:hypothetical protein